MIRAVKENHLAMLRRGRRAADGFDREANALKAELRKLDGPAAARLAAERFAALAAKYAAAIQALLRQEAERVAKEIAAALARMPGVQPLPAAVPPALAEAIIPKSDNPYAKVALAGGLVAFILAGMSAGVAGQEGAMHAVDLLAGRARRMLRYSSVATANRATRAVVEAAIPVAKRVGVVVPIAPRISPANVFPTPAPPPIVIPPLVPVGKRGPRGPQPGEPEFVILPEPRPVPVVPTPPPIDPNPLPPVSSSPNLLGWQVLSMLLPTTREKHRHRHRDIFYYHPRPERGERGMDECPSPPYESPRDGGVMAWNCVCRLSPIFEEPG